MGSFCCPEKPDMFLSNISGVLVNYFLDTLHLFIIINDFFFHNI